MQEKHMQQDSMSGRTVSETELLQALRTPDSSGQLKELVSTVYQYHKIVGGPIRVFPKGIPHPDTIRASFTANPKAFASLVDRLVTDGRVLNLDAFPLGTPRPDVFQVNIEFR